MLAARTRETQLLERRVDRLERQLQERKEIATLLADDNARLRAANTRLRRSVQHLALPPRRH